MRFRAWIESLELTALRRHLKNPSVDIANHAWEFLNWRGSAAIMKRLQIDPKKFRKDMENVEDDFYSKSEFIEKSMSKSEQQDFVSHISRHNPGDAPTHSLMDLQSNLGRKGYLPPTTWLIHFTDDAESVWAKGFKQGQSDIERLALTVHQNKAEKQYGGYNFAFIANSRYAQRSARSGKYGSNAVMFQAAGIPVYHYSDEEEQVIVWGQDVPTSRIVMLTSDGDEWTVRSKKGRDPFTGEFTNTVNWVMNNYNQYKKLL